MVGAFREEAVGRTARPRCTGRRRDLHSAEWLDAVEELAASVGSWQDTLDDAEALTLLRDCNAAGGTLHRPQQVLLLAKSVVQHESQAHASLAELLGHVVGCGGDVVHAEAVAAA
jgi:hypothetical protein